MTVDLIKSLRPVQWTKNLLLFAGAVFSQQLFHQDIFLNTLAAFCLFCMISSSSYIINDLMDINADRQHPKKSKRPIASGKISVTVAGITAFILGVAGIVLSFYLRKEFGFICLFYFVMTLSYSIKL